MLHLKLSIANIQYEQTLSALFPVLMDQLKRADSSSLPVQLLQKVGGRSEKAVISIMNRLDLQMKNQLLLHLFSSNKPQLMNGLKDFLQSSGYGIDFSDVSLSLSAEGQFFCCFHQVSVDYQALSTLIPEITQSRKGLGFAAAATGFLLNLGVGDSALIALFKNDAARRTVAQALEQMLSRNGIVMEVADCEVLKAGANLPAQTAEENPVLPPAVLDALVDAIAGYVIDLIDHYESN